MATNQILFERKLRERTDGTLIESRCKYCGQILLGKAKPITLLCGGELLGLLEKHDHRARINLAEARLLAAEQEKATSAKISS
jgi:hypothetical protein